MKYEISYKNALTHTVNVRILIKTLEESSTTLKLAKWRPGRYEFMNFAANVYIVRAQGKGKRNLNVYKSTTHTWIIEHEPREDITIDYDYYAHALDGGGSYLDEHQLYINPINCLLYVDANGNTNCELKLCNWDGETIATSLRHENGTLFANSYDELFDSPIICSPTIKNYRFFVGKAEFVIWIQGKHGFEIEKLVADFKSYTTAQLAVMPDCFDQPYHYLIEMVPYKFYHGVEHSYSTTIVLGSADDGSPQLYENLLGVCSHELFHFWNVKRIRPKELVKYSYNKEVYFNTGYVAEGFTTYYGDLFLIRGGVFDIKWYLNELNKLLKKHFENFGRQISSLHLSSTELWVDGYKPSAPNRKVSIYNEGSLFALITDLKLRKLTDNKSSLDSVMQEMMRKYGDGTIGYSDKEICEIISTIATVDLTDYFDKMLSKCDSIETELKNALNWVGLKLEFQQAETKAEQMLGIKTLPTDQDQNLQVVSIAPDSIGENHFSVGDVIVEVNDGLSTNGMESLQIDTLAQFKIKRFGEYYKIGLTPRSASYYSTYTVVIDKEALQLNVDNRNKWLNLESNDQ
jgi:predicted metalloprotease with PDZ domain